MQRNAHAPMLIIAKKWPVFSGMSNVMSTSAIVDVDWFNQCHVKLDSY